MVLYFLLYVLHLIRFQLPAMTILRMRLALVLKYYRFRSVILTVGRLQRGMGLIGGRNGIQAVLHIFLT